jgi:hypothetical protein
MTPARRSLDWPDPRVAVVRRHPWIRYSDGGTTSTHNCQALCPRHHHVKDNDTAWTVQPLDGGELKWTSPTGHVYTKSAATYPIDRTTVVEPAEERPATDPDPPPF